MARYLKHSSFFLSISDYNRTEPKHAMFWVIACATNILSYRLPGCLFLSLLLVLHSGYWFVLCLLLCLQLLLLLLKLQVY